jgi:Ca2+-binding EF-hand superfamily protein
VTGAEVFSIGRSSNTHVEVLTMNIGSISTQGSSVWNLANKVQSGGTDTNALQKFFKLLDANGDGNVTESEMTSLPQRIAEKKFGEADTDSNGTLSKDEFLNMLKSLQDRMPPQMNSVGGQSGMPSVEDIFKEADTDGDGALSKDEFTALDEKMRSQGPQGAQNVTGMPSVEDIFKAADTNGDGAISKDEFTALDEKMRSQGPQGSQNAAGMPSAEDMFTQADTNGDGAISKDEFSAMHEKMRPPMPPGGGPGGGGSPGNVESADSASGTQASSSSSSTSTDPADANGDGTVTLRERLAYLFGQSAGNNNILQMLGQSTDLVA